MSQLIIECQTRCDRHYNDGLIYGCEKPFLVDMSGCLVDIFKRKINIKKNLIVICETRLYTLNYSAVF